MTTLDIRNTTRSNTPSFPYQKALDTVLPGWDMSLAFVGEVRAQKMNVALRKKTYVPNVLSYESGISEHAKSKNRSGEIVICLQVAKKQAPSYEMSYTNFVGFLFIHGLLHLKGRAHGTTMEKEERALLARLTSVSHSPTNNGTTHRNRH